MNYENRLKVGFGVVLVVVLTWQSGAQAQIYTLADNNTTARIDVGSQQGMFYWGVQSSPDTMVNQLNKQWFWYRIGSDPERSIDTISAPVISGLSLNTLTSTYYDSLQRFNLGITYTLQGGLLLSGTADIGELIRINNTSGAELEFHFFQYSDFDLNGVPTGDSVLLSKNAFTGKFNQADQLGGPSLVEVVNTPGANHGEADVVSATLDKLNDAFPTILDDTKLTASGDVAWALQWDVSIPAGGSLLISKDKRLDLQFVPEPGPMAFMGLLLAIGAMRRRLA